MLWGNYQTRSDQIEKLFCGKLDGNKLPSNGYVTDIKDT